MKSVVVQVVALTTVLGALWTVNYYVDTTFLHVDAYELAEAKSKADIELTVARIKLKQAQREYTELLQRKEANKLYPGDPVRLISVEHEIKEHISNITTLEQIK